MPSSLWHHGAVTAGSLVSVAIVEDDAVLRDSLALLVEASDECCLVGRGGSVTEGFALLAEQPDVLLLDLALPDGSGLDVIAHCRSERLRTKVLVLTVFADVASVMSAIEAGADGYLLKDSDPFAIANAIRTVLNGGAPISPSVASHILARLRHEDRRDESRFDFSLTTKEREILEVLVSGRSTKEVAAHCGISVHTVGDHIKSIYRKLSVNSRGEAVYKAIRSGVIEIESS